MYIIIVHKITPNLVTERDNQSNLNFGARCSRNPSLIAILGSWDFPKYTYFPKNCIHREEVLGLAKSRPALTEVPPVFLYHCSHILAHFLDILDHIFTCLLNYVGRLYWSEYIFQPFFILRTEKNRPKRGICSH